MKKCLIIISIIFFISCKEDSPTENIENVKEEPIIKMISPIEGQINYNMIFFEIEATDNKGITKIELYANDSLLTQLYTKPYIYEWEVTPSADSAQYTTFAIAYDGDNNTTSSNVVTVICKKFNAPISVSYEHISHNSIKLAWVNDSSDEENIIVERSTNLEEFSKIASLPNNSTSYLDTELNEINFYSYRIAAIRPEIPITYSDTLKIEFGFKLNQHWTYYSSRKIYQTDFLPNSPYIVVALDRGNNGLLIFDYSSSSSTEIGTFNYNNFTIQSFAINKTKNEIVGGTRASGSNTDKLIKWDLSSWEVLEVLDSYPSNIEQIDYSRPGNYIATYGEDKKTYLVNSDSLEILGNIPMVKSPQFNSASNKIYTIELDGDIQVYSVPELNFLKSISSFFNPSKLIISSDDHYLYSYGGQGVLYDLLNDTELNNELPSKGCFLEGQNILVYLNGPILSFYDLLEQRDLFSTQFGGWSRMYYSPDSEALLFVENHYIEIHKIHREWLVKE